MPPSPAQAYAPQPLYSPQQAAAAPQSIAGLIEPKKVKTVSVRPDGSVLPNDAAPQTIADIAAQSPAAQSPAAQSPAASHAASKTATPKSTARVATAAKPAAASPKPAQVADAGDAQTESAPATSTHANGAFAVQLAAPSSEQEARDIQARLIKKYGADIPGFHPAIRKAVSGEKTVYRVRTVGLSKDEATALCQKVQSSGGNCFVAKN